MWSAWFVVGLLLLVTKRYAKKTWFLSHMLHSILGTFTLIVTIVFSLKVSHFNPFGDMHNALGTICVVATAIGALAGYVTAGMQAFYNEKEPWTKKDKALFVAKIHRWSGYVMLFIGNAAIMTGVGHYYGDKLKGDERKVLGFFSCIVFVILVAIFEGIYRIRNNYSMGHIETPDIAKAAGKVSIITPEQLDKQVKAGKSLVVLDNLVLDLKGYEKVHPGGKFNLRHNLGRDVSKFFFGGYQLVNKQN